MVTNASKQRPIKTANKKQGFPSLTAGENWGKYLAGMATEIVYGFVLCAIALGLAILMLAVVR